MPLSAASTDTDTAVLLSFFQTDLLSTLQQLLFGLFTSYASARLLIFRGTSYLVVINTSNTKDIVLQFGQKTMKSLPIYVVNVSSHSLESNK